MFANEARGLCEKCREGRYSGGGASNCSVCADGQEANSVRVGCVKCSAGRAGTGGACGHCALGWAPDTVVGGTKCLPCLGDGVYSTGTRCSRCSAGQQPGPQRARCDNCAAGKHSAHGVNCSRCGPQLDGLGWAPNLPQGARECWQCYPGTYSNENTTACTPCPKGQHSVLGATACSWCSSGYELKARPNAP